MAMCNQILKYVIYEQMTKNVVNKQKQNKRDIHSTTGIDQYCKAQD